MTDDAAALLNSEAKDRLLKLAETLANSSWQKADLEQNLQAFLEHNGLKMRDIGLPLRAAVTGMKQTPSIVDIMAALGEDETLGRLRLACK
jgi:glutamyl-tRNA synthetase